MEGFPAHLAFTMRAGAVKICLTLSPHAVCCGGVQRRLRVDNVSNKSPTPRAHQSYDCDVRKGALQLSQFAGEWRPTASGVWTYVCACARACEKCVLSSSCHRRRRSANCWHSWVQVGWLAAWLAGWLAGWLLVGCSVWFKAVVHQSMVLSSGRWRWHPSAGGGLGFQSRVRVARGSVRVPGGG